MATTTYTGVLTDLRGQVSIANGVDPPLLLALPDEDNPIASAAGAFAKFGQTDPVTVRGTMGKAGNFTVLFVTSIEAAADEAEVRRPAKRTAAKKANRKKSAT